MQPNEALSVDEIRLGDPAFWVLPPEIREGAFRTLRRERPISFHQEVDDRLFPPGPGFWALSRHADIMYAGTHPKLFCSGKGATSIADIPTDFLEFYGSMINMDAPKHGRLRRLVSTAFTERLLSRVEHEVQQAASRVIVAVAEKGECDFVTEIAAPFPIRIICEMMGIPESQHGFVFEQTNIILGLGDPDITPDMSDLGATLMASGAALAELMKDLRHHRLERPTEDLTSALVHAEIDGDRLTEQEMGSF